MEVPQNLGGLVAIPRSLVRCVESRGKIRGIESIQNPISIRRLNRPDNSVAGAIGRNGEARTTDHWCGAHGG